jgi:hypothetical protein
METITFTFKTKVEQFKEQFPELYQEIYDIGYTDGQANNQYGEDPYEGSPWDNEAPTYAQQADNSERFHMWNTWETINNKAQELVDQGYQAGNRNWIDFMNVYKDWKQCMYIAWNPAHKLFAVESDLGVIDEFYPHLVNSTFYCK